MATRDTRLIIKKSIIPSQALPNSGVLLGEGLISLGDGILHFSGGTSGSPTWVPSDNNAGYFEVGSNLYDLKIRNQITSYSGLTNLSGKFLSGTTNGFVLAPIADIAGVDSYVDGGTYNSATSAITLTVANQSNVTITGIADNYTTGVTFDGSLAHFDRNDTLSAYTLDLSTFVSTADTYTTAFTYDNANELTISRNQGQPDISVSINTMTGLTVDGTLTATTVDGASILSGGTDLSTIFSQTDYFTTGATLIGDTIYFDTNETVGPLSAYTVDLSGLDVNDTFVSAFTYNSASSTFTIDMNDGATFDALINSVTGLTVSNLTAGRVVYVGSGGLLTDEAGFTYNAGTDTLTAGNLDATTDLTVGGDAIIQGSLTVFGAAVSAFTSELYVEDSNITLNYNPTGNTNVTSINSGWSIQDGDGSGNTVNLQIVSMPSLTGLTAGNVPDITEYNDKFGYSDRGWITQLNDIVIRSTDVLDNEAAGTINGVRVLAEFDILDGGSYD